MPHPASNKHTSNHTLHFHGMNLFNEKPGATRQAHASH
jgi:hypothetical protein